MEEKTLMGQKLEQALSEYEKNSDNFVWKGEKVKVNGSWMQKQLKLTDASEEQLNSFYIHCNAMLYNKSKDKPGRVVVLKTINSAKIKCGIELFLRFCEANGTSRVAVLDSIKGAIENNNIKSEDSKFYLVSDMLNAPVEFRNLPINQVIDGCLDKLGKFDSKIITLSFLLKQGLWISREDYKDLYELDSNGKERDKREVAIERLFFKKSMNIKFTPDGLSFTKMRAMLNLKPRKYSEMTTEQLNTLRGRVLYALEDEVTTHINFWKKKKEQIEQVVKEKGFKLNEG